jgi:hypothetical protein
MARTSAVELLRKRLRELDAHDPPTGDGPSDRRLQHFVVVMSSFTEARMESECGSDVASPDIADALIDGSVLLHSLTSDEPHLVRGPLRRDLQQWVGTGRRGLAFPSEARSRDVHTATATRCGPSMWRTYLNIHYEPSLHPLPWSTWQIEVDAGVPVLEVTSAREWTDFVERHPLRETLPVEPDWVSAAQDYAGVHLTLTAIAAAQGFSFPTSRGPTEPQYWDAESTRWLWRRFGTPVLVETTTERPSGC